MRVHTVNQLIEVIGELFPATFESDAHSKAWSEQYRATLSALEPDELNGAWHRVLDGWKRKTAPMPADILAAHRNRTGKSVALSGHDGDQLKTHEFLAKLAKRDQDLRDEKQRIIAEWTNNHPKLCADAAQVGFSGALETFVSRAAGILAQRNTKRASGVECGPIDIPGLYLHEGCEQVIVPRDEIDKWRHHIENPTRSFVRNVGTLKHIANSIDQR